MSTLIYNPTRIGDFILSIGALRWFKESALGEEITLVVSPETECLARFLFPDLNIIVVRACYKRLRDDIPAWLTYFSLLGKKYDRCLVLRHPRSIFYVLSLFFLRAGHFFLCTNPQARLDKKNGVLGRFWVRTHSIEIQNYPESIPAEGCRELEAHRLVVSAALRKKATIEEVTPRLDISRAGQKKAIICPHASGTIRDIPEALVETAIDTFLSLGLSEIEIVTQRAADLGLLMGKNAEKWGPFVKVCQASDALDLLQKLTTASAVVSADTGPAHMAVALDLPSIILLGGGDFGSCGPWCRSNKQTWLFNRTDCYGCGFTCIHPEPYCLTGIKADVLRAEIRRIVTENCSV